MDVWKLPILSRREPDFVEVEGKKNRFKNRNNAKVEKAREFCFKENWAGVGWGLENIKADLTDHNDYIRVLRKSRHKDAEDRSIRFARELKEGDFVWCRAKGDVYWLGRITGPWQYKHSGKFDDFDLYQVRTCRWERIGHGGLVPGPVKNSFAGRGQAISRIKREGAEALFASVAIWEAHTGERIELPREITGGLSIKGVSHDDLEDIVGLYLQKELGWYLVPSTGKHANRDTEFVLRNKEGKAAYVQVKSGVTRIEEEIIVPKEVDVFYVYYPLIDQVRAKETEYLNHQKIICLETNKLRAFVANNGNLFPEFLRRLL